MKVTLFNSSNVIVCMSVLFWLLIQTLNSFDSYVGWSIAEFKKKYVLTHNYVMIYNKIATVLFCCVLFNNNNNNNNKLQQASLRRWLTRKPSMVATCAKIEK